MIFEIKYVFSIKRPVDFSKANDDNLRYTLFLGSVYLSEDTQSIPIGWDWIPLLDFAICLHGISSGMGKKQIHREEFEFTESNEKVIFEQEKGRVKISTSFSDEVLNTTVDNFQQGVQKFYESLLTDLVNKNPALEGNEAFRVYLKRIKK